MSIKLELEEREWEVIVRLVQEERNPQGRNKRFLSGEDWNALVDKLIDSKLKEAEPQGMQSCVVSMDAKQAFNFLNDEPISREKDDE